jgi:hypothetical protein
MKKMSFILICCFGIAFNIYAQYPIPSYNVPVFPGATFSQGLITPSQQKYAPMEKRRLGIHVSQLIADTVSNSVIIYVYSLDGQTILGPFYLTGNETIYVDIDDRLWGVLVESGSKGKVSVWIE